MRFLEGVSKWLRGEVPLPWKEAKNPVVDEEKSLNRKIDVIVRVLVWYFIHINETKWTEELAKGEYVDMDEALSILENDGLKAKILGRLVQNKKIIEFVPRDLDSKTNSFEVMRRYELFKTSLRLARSRNLSFLK